MDHAADPLSPLAHELTHSAPDGYRRLTVTGPSPAAARRLLGPVTPGQLLSAPIKSQSAADALLAGLWLWHDCLEESHTISQAIASPTGSFWHAIMHRREGDFSNSKYWYARCRTHPVLRLIAAQAERYAPDAFVDLVESVHDHPKDPSYAAAVKLQQLEWLELFNACARSAVGAGELGI